VDKHLRCGSLERLAPEAVPPQRLSRAPFPSHYPIGHPRNTSHRRRALDVYHQLPSAIEDGWHTRFGENTIDILRESLRERVSEPTAHRRENRAKFPIRRRSRPARSPEACRPARQRLVWAFLSFLALSLTPLRVRRLSCSPFLKHGWLDNRGCALRTWLSCSKDANPGECRSRAM
jgi:hypothetical protein